MQPEIASTKNRTLTALLDENTSHRQWSILITALLNQVKGFVAVRDFSITWRFVSCFMQLF